MIGEGSGCRPALFEPWSSAERWWSAPAEPCAPEGFARGLRHGSRLHLAKGSNGRTDAGTNRPRLPHTRKMPAYRRGEKPPAIPGRDCVAQGEWSQDLGERP